MEELQQELNQVKKANGKYAQEVGTLKKEINLLSSNNTSLEQRKKNLENSENSMKEEIEKLKKELNLQNEVNKINFSKLNVFSIMINYTYRQETRELEIYKQKTRKLESDIEKTCKLANDCANIIKKSHRSYYHLLDVQECEKKQTIIRKAYHKLVAKYHPDKMQSNINSAKELVNILNECKLILLDAEIKPIYDKYLIGNCHCFAAEKVKEHIISIRDQEQADKLIADITDATNYYEVLGLKVDSTFTIDHLNEQYENFHDRLNKKNKNKNDKYEALERIHRAYFFLHFYRGKYNDFLEQHRNSEEGKNNPHHAHKEAAYEMYKYIDKKNIRKYNKDLKFPWKE